KAGLVWQIGVRIKLGGAPVGGLYGQLDVSMLVFGLLLLIEDILLVLVQLVHSEQGFGLLLLHLLDLIELLGKARQVRLRNLSRGPKRLLPRRDGLILSLGLGVFGE